MSFCSIIPTYKDAQGIDHPSAFYKDLWALTKDRELTTAHYLVIQNETFKRTFITDSMYNDYGEMKLEEYLKLLGNTSNNFEEHTEIVNSLNNIARNKESSIINISQSMNIMKDNYENVVYENAPEALSVANNYNTQGTLHNRFTALVYTIKKNGSLVYEVRLVPRTKASIRAWRKLQSNNGLLTDLIKILNKYGVQIKDHHGAFQSQKEVVDFDSAQNVVDGVLAIIINEDGTQKQRLASFYAGFGEFAFSFMKGNPLYDRLVAICSSEDYQKYIWRDEYTRMLETIPEEFKDNKGDYIAVKTAGKIVGDIILDRANYEQNTFKLIINRIINSIKTMFKRVVKDEVQMIKDKFSDAIDKDILKFSLEELGTESTRFKVDMIKKSDTTLREIVENGEQRTHDLFKVMDIIQTQIALFDRLKIQLPNSLVQNLESLSDLRNLTNISESKLRVIEIVLKTAISELTQIEQSLYSDVYSIEQIKEIRRTMGDKEFWKQLNRRSTLLYSLNILKEGYVAIAKIAENGLTTQKLSEDVTNSIINDINVELSITLPGQTKNILTEHSIARLEKRISMLYSMANVKQVDTTIKITDHLKQAGYKIDSPLTELDIKNIAMYITKMLGISGFQNTINSTIQDFSDMSSDFKKSVDGEINKMTLLFAETVHGGEYIGDPSHNIKVKNVLASDGGYFRDTWNRILFRFTSYAQSSAASSNFLEQIIDQAAKMAKQDTITVVEDYKREFRDRVAALPSEFRNDLTWLQEYTTDKNGKIKKTGKFRSPASTQKFKAAEEAFKQKLVDTYGISFKKIMSYEIRPSHVEMAKLPKEEQEYWKYKSSARKAYYKWKEDNTQEYYLQADNVEERFIEHIYQMHSSEKVVHNIMYPALMEIARKEKEYEDKKALNDEGIPLYYANNPSAKDENLENFVTTFTASFINKNDANIRETAVNRYFVTRYYKNPIGGPALDKVTYTALLKKHINLERSLYEWNSYLKTGNEVTYLEDAEFLKDIEQYPLGVKYTMKASLNISRRETSLDKETYISASANNKMRIPKLKQYKVGADNIPLKDENDNYIEEDLYNSEEFDNLTEEQKTFLEWTISKKIDFDKMLNVDTPALQLPQVWATGTELVKKFQIKTRFSKWVKDNFTSIEGDDLLFGQSKDVKDFNKNRIYLLPVAYVTKLKNPDFLTDDMGHAMTAYAQMAVSHNNMAKVVGAAELAETYLDIQLDGVKEKQRVKDNFRSAIDRQMYGVSTKKTNIKGVSIDKSMGHIFASSRLLILGYSFILPVVNTTTSMWELLTKEIFSGLIKGGDLNTKDLMWAIGHTAGFGVMGLADLGKNVKDQKIHLYRAYFDFEDKWGSNNLNTKFQRKGINNVISGLVDPMSLSTVGNNLISDLIYLAKLKHEKVLVDGKKTSLFYAFNTENNKLELKENVTTLDGQPVNQEYISRFKVKVNKYMVGIVGNNDSMSKNALNMTFYGKFMQFMKGWATGGIERSMGLKKYSVADKQWRSGYYRSTIKSLYILFTQLGKAFSKQSSESFWERMAPVENFTGEHGYTKVDEEYKTHVQQNYLRTVGSIIITETLRRFAAALLDMLRAKEDDDEEDDEDKYITDNNDGPLDTTAILAYFVNRSFREQTALSPAFPFYMYQDWRNLITPNSAGGLAVNRLVKFTDAYLSQDRERSGYIITDPEGYSMIAPYDKTTGEYDIEAAEFIDRNQTNVPKGYRLVRQFKYERAASKLLPGYNDRRMLFENDAKQMLNDYLVGKYKLK